MKFEAKDVIFVDVREPWEYRQKHLDNSILIPFNRLPFDLEKTIDNKNVPMVVFCSTGTRCKVAKDYMNNMGYDNIIGIGTLENALDIQNKIANNTFLL